MTSSPRLASGQLGLSLVATRRSHTTGIWVCRRSLRSLIGPCFKVREGVDHPPADLAVSRPGPIGAMLFQCTAGKSKMAASFCCPQVAMGQARRFRHGDISARRTPIANGRGPTTTQRSDAGVRPERRKSTQHRAFDPIRAGVSGADSSGTLGRSANLTQDNPLRCRNRSDVCWRDRARAAHSSHLVLSRTSPRLVRRGRSGEPWR
jgi:hypothetical protein